MIRPPARSSDRRGSPTKRLMRPDMPEPREMRNLRDAGRRGDTMIAHINPAEVGILRAIGGKGTRNPETGLLEFYNVAGGGIGAGAREGYGGGGFSGGGGAKGGSKGGNENAATGSLSADKRAGAYGPKPDAKSNGSNKGGSATVADSQVAKKLGLSHQEYDDAAGALRDMGTDYRGVNDSFGDRFGNFLASQLGFGEINPLSMSYKDLADFGAKARISGQPARAAWGHDLASLLGSVAGTVTGVPAVGTATSLASDALGNPLGLSTFGPDVFSSKDGTGWGYAGPSWAGGPGLRFGDVSLSELRNGRFNGNPMGGATGGGLNPSSNGSNGGGGPGSPGSTGNGGNQGGRGNGPHWEKPVGILSPNNPNNPRAVDGGDFGGPRPGQPPAPPPGIISGDWNKFRIGRPMPNRFGPGAIQPYRVRAFG